MQRIANPSMPVRVRLPPPKPVSLSARRRAWLRAGLLLLVSAGLAGEGRAQSGGRGRGGGKRQEQNRSQSGEPTQLSANDRFRLNLTKGRVALELKPAQESSWNSYANAALAAYEKTSPDATVLLE